MIVQIRDKSALASVPVANIFSYLESRGWNSQGPWGVSARPSFIPRNTGATACEILASYSGHAGPIMCPPSPRPSPSWPRVEERSQLDVFYDLKATGGST